MPTPAELTAATEQVITDSDLLHDIVHGAFDDPDVVTEGGNVSPVAKLLAAINAEGTGAVLTLLGIPSYANLTAANTALAIGKPYYDTTLNQLQITTA